MFWQVELMIKPSYQCIQCTRMSELIFNSIMQINCITQEALTSCSTFWDQDCGENSVEKFLWRNFCGDFRLAEKFTFTPEERK